MISQSFPPIGETGSRRALALAKQFVRKGVNVDVITEKIYQNDYRYDNQFGYVDDSINVIRFERDSSITKNKLFVDRLYDIFNPICKPISFSRSVLKQYKQFIDNINYDLIWATFPDHTNLYLANSISMELNIPWVADFRDFYQYQDNFKKKILYPIRISAIKKMIGTSNHIITVSEGLKENIIQETGYTPEVIMNAYDPDDYTLFKPTAPKNNKIQFLYTGSIKIGSLNLTLLLDVLHNLAEEKKIQLDDFEIKICGHHNDCIIKNFKKHKVGQIVINSGYISRQRVIQMQKNSDILIQHSWPGLGVPTSKIFEYLAAMRPILSLQYDDGPVDRIIKETKSGFIASDFDDLKEIVQKWYIEWKDKGYISYRGDEFKVREHSFELRAKQYLELFQRII